MGLGHNVLELGLQNRESEGCSAQCMATLVRCTAVARLGVPLQVLEHLPEKIEKNQAILLLQTLELPGKVLRVGQGKKRKSLSSYLAGLSLETKDPVRIKIAPSYSPAMYLVGKAVSDRGQGFPVRLPERAHPPPVHGCWWVYLHVSGVFILFTGL